MKEHLKRVLFAFIVGVAFGLLLSFQIATLDLLGTKGDTININDLDTCTEYVPLLPMEPFETAIDDESIIIEEV
jgi:hypothetical protein